MIFSLYQIVYAGVDNGKGDKSIKSKQIVSEEKEYQKGLSKGEKREIKEEIILLNKQIKQNKQELLALRSNIRDVTISIQNKVYKLSSKKAVMTQAEVSDLQTVLSLVKNSKKGIKVFKIDGLKQYLIEGKTLRDNYELDKAKEHMDKSIELQEDRKQILNETIDNLNTAEQLLSQYEELN